MLMNKLLIFPLSISHLIYNYFTRFYGCQRNAQAQQVNLPAWWFTLQAVLHTLSIQTMMQQLAGRETHE